MSIGHHISVGNAGIAQLVEQLIRNSKRAFGAVFQDIGQRVFQSWPEASWFARRCAGLRGFAAKIRKP
jgi:hypothetical protein